MKSWLRNGQLAKARTNAPGAGYTLTEVLIVLAVTTVMFASVAVLLRGRQANVEFTQSVRDYETKLLNIMSDVRTGYYNTGFTCSAPVTGTPIITNTPAPPASNSACIFVGKVIQANAIPGSTISTLIGRRTVSGATSDDIETLAQARPVVATVASESYEHPFRLRVHRIIRQSNNAISVYAIGFINKLSGGVANAAPGEGGGSNTIELYGLLNSASLVSPAPAVDVVNFVPLTDGVIICLRGQNTDQFAEISVGGGNSQTGMITTINKTAGTRCA